MDERDRPSSMQNSGLVNTKMLFIVTQASLEACFYLSIRLSTTAQGKFFSTDITANGHFCSLVFEHVSSPPLVYCGREESFLEPKSCARCTFFNPCHHNKIMNGMIAHTQF